MNGAEFRAKRRALGFTQEAMARRMGTTSTTIARWEASRSSVNEGWARLAFEAIEYESLNSGEVLASLNPQQAVWFLARAQGMPAERPDYEALATAAFNVP